VCVFWLSNKIVPSSFLLHADCTHNAHNKMSQMLAVVFSYLLVGFSRPRSTYNFDRDLTTLVNEAR